MPGRRPPRPSAPETTAPDGVLTLAVLSPQRRRRAARRAAASSATGIRLEFVRKGVALDACRRDVGGVLWELSPDDGSHRLRVGAHRQRAGGVLQPGSSNRPRRSSRARSDSAQHLSRAAAPRRRRARARACARSLDLADRIDAAAPRLVQLASRPEAIGALMRAVNASLDPADVAQRARRARHRVAAAHGVVRDRRRAGRRAAARSATQMPDPATQERGRVVRRRHRADRAAGRARHQLPRRPRRRARAPGEARSRPRRSAGRSSPTATSSACSSAWITAGRAGCRRMPQALADALARLLEPAAYALANALRVARAEALSVTDDLTQLYNSRYPERRAAQGDEARDAQRLAAVAAVHRSRRVQADQRRPRPPARQPGAHRGGRRHSSQRPGDRHRGPIWRRRVRDPAARKPASDGAQSVARRLRDRIPAVQRFWPTAARATG